MEDTIDAAVAKLRERFERKADRVSDKLASKQAKLVELEGVAKSRQLEEAVNIGATLMSFSGGRKKSFGTAVSKRRQSSRASSRVDRTKGEIERLEDEIEELTQDLEDAVSEIREKHEAALDEIEEREVRLEKNDIDLVRFGILWVPSAAGSDQRADPATNLRARHFRAAF